MESKIFKLIIIVFLISPLSNSFSAGGVNKSISRDTAKVFIISPIDNAVVENPITVIFGVSDMQISPAGMKKAYSGHHHLLIDVINLPDLMKPIPSDENHIHFGNGQTRTEINLDKGRHTLQLLLGDHLHVPHIKPVISKKISIIVK